MLCTWGYWLGRWAWALVGVIPMYERSYTIDAANLFLSREASRYCHCKHEVPNLVLVLQDL